MMIALHHEIKCNIKVPNNNLSYEKLRGRPFSPHQPSSTLLAIYPPRQRGFPYLGFLKVGHSIQGEIEEWLQ